MILTCPECASRYFVDDAKVGPEGRNVRCANCGNRWHAAAPAPKAPEPPPRPAPAAPPQPATDLPDDLAFVEPEAAAPDVAEPAQEVVEVAPPPPVTIKAAKPRRAPAAAAWAGLIVLIALVLAALVVFRAAVVRAVPNTASAYAALGLPVNPVGLVIEEVRARPSMQDGHAALTVTGVLRNVETHDVMAPPMRISLLNTAGKAVAGKVAAAGDPLIPAGESRHFSVDLLDPPSTAKDLEIVFVMDGVKPSPVKAAVSDHGEAAKPDAAHAPAAEDHAAPAPAPAAAAGHH